MSRFEIEAVLDIEGTAARSDRERVEVAANLIGRTLADGIVTAFARPFGGGEPVRIKPTLWELDRFIDRFTTCAIALSTPFDEVAPRTHWIFVDTEDFNRVLEASFGSTPSPARIGKKEPSVVADDREKPESYREERFVRLPEVKRRTGLSRSTIYSRMDAGSFPRSMRLSGNIAAWRESDLEAWLTDPR